jgi:AcrR family transcriptional regulator
MLEFLAAGGRGWLTARPLYYWSQAFGTISRRWTETGSGRWRYNFLSAAEANAEVLSAMQTAGEQDLANLLQRRVRAFQQLHWMQHISRLRAEGAAPTTLARTVLSHPSIWPLIARRGIRRAAKAMPLRSPVRA